jgi:site-specific recombinase
VGKRLQEWRIAFRGGRLRDLNSILQSSLDVQKAAAPDLLDWLRALVRYVRGERGFRFTPQARLHLLLQRLRQHPDWAAAVGVILARILERGSALRIFTEAGLPSSASFGKELTGRLVRSVIPPVFSDGSLSGVIEHVFAQHRDARWMERIPSNESLELASWLRATIPSERRQALVGEAAQAVRLLGNRVAAIALRDEVAARSPRSGRLSEHPMMTLDDATRAFERDIEEGRTPDMEPLGRRLDDARTFLDGVMAQIQERGVSVDLVFQIERATAYLDRIERLAVVVTSVENVRTSDDEKSRLCWAFFVELVRGALEDRRPGRVIGHSAHLIARKTVERAGETGEGGIAWTSAELRHMLSAAIGGGVFVALTALVKYLQPKGLPPFFDALYGALNYSGSFVLMHFLHLKLATKMPAMTASALASRMHDPPTADSDAAFATTAIAILRTQFAAVAGNILGVIPAAFAVDTLVRLTTYSHVLTAEKAQYTLASIVPWASPTIPFAMLTGVILWVCGWAASWLDNAFDFYNLPGAIKSHGGLRARLGESRVATIADFLAANVGGVTAAVVLGTALAYVPEIGRFFGLPLEVRHVTLVTGSLALSVAATEFARLSADLPAMAAGIAIIGACNLGVAFALAFAMALRARRISAWRGTRLLARTAFGVLQRPWRLFVAPEPPAGGKETTNAHA